MRKKTAILFLLVFAFTQYAKQLRFLECTLTNTFISLDTPPCDCTKASGLDQTDNRTDLPVHTHSKTYSEETIQLNKEIQLSAPFIEAVKMKQVWSIDRIRSGNLPLPWHPPCL
ncbi:MAG TPA: hypothetical protein PLL23_06085 [Chitinophagaceae bacterium]|nr:hypothetical protein [Chitinophagaceae bacterium]